MITVHQLFSHVCGQVHVGSVGGQLLPFCERCTGLYVGAVCALLAWLLFRPRPTNPLLWAHGVALLLMIPFGYHLVPQSADVRTLTGYVFAFGLTYFFLLIPATYVRLGPKVRGDATSYAIACATGAAVLMTAIKCGDAFVASMLKWIGFTGLLLLGTLALLNLLLPLCSLRSSRRAGVSTP